MAFRSATKGEGHTGQPAFRTGIGIGTEAKQWSYIHLYRSECMKADLVSWRGRKAVLTSHPTAEQLVRTGRQNLPMEAYWPTAIPYIRTLCEARPKARPRSQVR